MEFPDPYQYLFGRTPILPSPFGKSSSLRA